MAAMQTQTQMQTRDDGAATPAAESRRPLTQLPAWRALQQHYQQVKDIRLRTLFAQDSGRGERLVAEGAGLYLDYSKHRVVDETLRLLAQLAEESGLRERIAAMFGGE